MSSNNFELSYFFIEFYQFLVYHVFIGGEANDIARKDTIAHASKQYKK